MAKNNHEKHNNCPHSNKLAGKPGRDDQDVPGVGGDIDFRQFDEVRENLVKDNEGYVHCEDGTRLYYRVVGAGSPVIIPNARMLAADLMPLAQENQLIFYDQRGRGGSDAIKDKSLLWLGYEVADIERVRQHFGFEKISLIGWSYMGAMVALYAQDHGQHVNRLVLVCPISIRHPAPYDEQQAAAGERAEKRLDPTRVKRLAEMKEAGLDKEDPIAYCREHLRTYTPRQMGKPEALSRMKSDPCIYANEGPQNIAKHWQNHFPSDSQQRDWRSRLSSLDIPTLIIHGMQDLIPLAAAQEWASVLPNGRLLTLPESGHFPHLEMPEAYFSAIGTFLEGEWPSGAVSLNV